MEEKDSRNGEILFSTLETASARLYSGSSDSWDDENDSRLTAATYEFQRLLTLNRQPGLDV